MPRIDEGETVPRPKREFGTIRKRGNGRFQAYYLGPDGNFQRAPKTFQARIDAEAWLMKERALLEADDWTPVKSRRAKVTRAASLFGPYAERWIEQRELKPRTRALYRDLLDRFILPAFEDVSLRDVTPAVVRVWWAGLDPSRPTQRAHAYSLMRTIMATALDDEIIAMNPCRVRGAGSTARARQIKPATLAELEALTRELPDRYAALVLLAAWCGLRWGELTELRRRDVDVKRGVLSVRRGVTRVGHDVIVGDPKTSSSIRDVTVPPHLLPLLTHHLATFTAKGPDALLFTAVGDPTLHLHSNTFRRHWTKAREAAGRPDLRFHDLRHTGAVLAASTGATLAELMARLGHSTSAAALRYQHVAAGRDAEIARKLSALAVPATTTTEGDH